MIRSKYRIIKTHEDASCRYVVKVPMLFGFWWTELRDENGNKRGACLSFESCIAKIKADLISSIKVPVEKGKPQAEVLYDLRLEKSVDGLFELDSILEYSERLKVVDKATQLDKENDK